MKGKYIQHRLDGNLVWSEVVSEVYTKTNTTIRDDSQFVFNQVTQKIITPIITSEAFVFTTTGIEVNVMDIVKVIEEKPITTSLVNVLIFYRYIDNGDGSLKEDVLAKLYYNDSIPVDNLVVSDYHSNAYSKMVREQNKDFTFDGYELLLILDRTTIRSLDEAGNYIYKERHYHYNELMKFENRIKLLYVDHKL